jgi:hypothetical protein
MSSAGSQGLMAKTWYGSFPRGALRQGRNAAPPPRWGCAMVYAAGAARPRSAGALFLGTSDRAASSRATAACISLMITCLRADCRWISRTERVLRQARYAKGSSTAQSRCVPLRAQCPLTARAGFRCGHTGTASDQRRVSVQRESDQSHHNHHRCDDCDNGAIAPLAISIPAVRHRFSSLRAYGIAYGSERPRGGVPSVDDNLGLVQNENQHDHDGYDAADDGTAAPGSSMVYRVGRVGLPLVE